ncbi:hypothetical protein H0H92_003677 [Tricholoma furcatifolium]|nr:hypothetical protein H0H92_003677 [Tricholoma furcatifolium]
MPSFRSICLLATTAFAAFASRSTDVEARAVDIAVVDANDLVVPKVVEHEPLLEVRGSQPSLPDIVNTCYESVLNAQVQVNVLIKAGGVISVDNCTPYLTDINSALLVALAAVEGLEGLTLDVILGTSVTLVGIANLAGQLANLLIVGDIQSILFLQKIGTHLQCIVTILLAIITAVGTELAPQIVSIVTDSISVTLVEVLNLVLQLVGTLIDDELSETLRLLMLNEVRHKY